MMGILGNVDDALLGAFFFHAAILVLKMFLVTFMTTLTRLGKDVSDWVVTVNQMFHALIDQVFANPEDAAISPRGKVRLDDPDVERMRRIHRNDMENIFPFLLLGLGYLTTQPSAGQAMWLFRIFTASRIIHTVVYALKVRKIGNGLNLYVLQMLSILQVPQPARGLAFFIGLRPDWRRRQHHDQKENDPHLRPLGRLMWVRLSPVCQTVHERELRRLRGGDLEEVCFQL